jgi:hypothetical protein
MKNVHPLLATAAALAWCSNACAIFIPPPPPYPVVPSSVNVNPAGPSSTQAVTVTIHDRYNGGELQWIEPYASAKSIAWRMENNTIYITAELKPGPYPEGQSIPTVTIPPLPNGRYAVVYDGSANLTHPEIHKATREFIVSDTNVVTVVEFFNAQLGHFFITADVAEIAALDHGTLRGWTRTGESFRVYSADAAATARIPTMCRLYGLPAAGIDSHFFSSTSYECDEVVRRWPDFWVLETRSAFGAAIDPPASPDTTCGDGAVPLYRLYNNRPDANHRYTTSRATRDQMLARGWILEGPNWDFVPAVPGDVKQFEMCVFR